MDRRTYLKSAGAALGSCAFASTGVAAIEYDQTVDIVDAGADPTGSEPIDDVFQDVAENGTLVEFPDGEYVINHLGLYQLQNFGMRATGDVTLVPGPDYDTDAWIGGGDTRNLLFEGFTIDSTADGISPTVVISSFDGLIVRDVLKRGSQNDGSTAFDFRILDTEGAGLIERVEAPDGDTGENGTAVGLYVNTDGTLTVRDCRLEGFTNNGLYGSGSDGPVQVEGGFYRNNNVASIRLSSEGSYVKSANIVVDDPKREDGNYRGIRVSDGPGPVTIEDVDIRLESGQGSGGVVGAYSGGSFDLRNSRISVSEDYSIVGTNEISGHAVMVDNASGIDDPGERTIQNLSVTGDASGYAAVRLRRDNNTIEGAQILQTGADQNGVLVEDISSNNVIRDSDIEVTGEQIANNGDAVIENISDEATPEEATITNDGNGGGGGSGGGGGGTTTQTPTQTPEPTPTSTPTPTETTSTPTQTQTQTETQTSTTTRTQTQTSTPTQTQTKTSTPTKTKTSTSTRLQPEASKRTRTQIAKPTTVSESEPESESKSESNDEGSLYPISSPESNVYATMATTDDAPTATVWGSFRCPYVAKFVANNFQHIVDEFVRSGDLRLRYRTLPYDYDDPDFPGIEEAKGGVLAAEYGLGVWELDPERYWAFFQLVFDNQPDGDWVTQQSMDAFMRAAGVRNRDQVHARVESDQYHSVVKQTTEDATDFDITLAPRITFRGDKIPARRDTDVVLEWIRDRL